MRSRFLLWGALGGCACGRLGFDELSGDGGVGSVALSAAPNSGGLEGEIALSWEALDLSGADRLDIRRGAGDSAPADCDSDELAVSLTDLSQTSAIDRVVDRWNRTHSYRACVYDSGGAAVAGDDMVSEGARYYNPEPNCSQPPCTPIRIGKTTTCRSRGRRRTESRVCAKTPWTR